LECIEKSGSIKSDNVHCISIIGQIEGHYVLPSDQKTTKYEHIVPLLFAIERSTDIEGVLIILNTLGGDVESGLAIAELIASMKKPTVSLVLGGGHSIGVPLAVCAKKSFIVPSATMTIHPVRVSGTVIGTPQTYFYFEKMQNRIIKFICDNSKISKEKLKSLMLETDQIATDTGSVIDGNEAVEIGLIDEIGGLTDALNALDDMIKNKNQCDGESCKI
ncbi:MAG: ATP-dependent Clp protease proteolytic subunit, partial [Clostridia bacterium]|nr:ATP-dependent Clp protease proteolytic subunit [Clostridia bacterium]